jgi:hypothetical protein
MAGLDQSAFNRHRLNAEKLIAFKSIEQLSASDRTRVALESCAIISSAKAAGKDRIMKLIRRLVIVVAVFAAVVTGVGLMLPGSVHVERSAVIAATPAQIFPYMNDLRKFNEWSPWARRDPGTKYAFTGPDSGAGAAMTWQSEKHGAGRQRITASVPDEKVTAALDFGARARERVSPGAWIPRCPITRSPAGSG